MTTRKRTSKKEPAAKEVVVEETKAPLVAAPETNEADIAPLKEKPAKAEVKKEDFATILSLSPEFNEQGFATGRWVALLSTDAYLYISPEEFVEKKYIVGDKVKIF